MADFDSPVEEIKRRIDLVDYIREFVPLTQAGTNFKARCPFHNEKTPSFMVSRDRGMWHCFGCSKGGDVFTFLQEMEGIEFVEALRILAARAGVTLRRQDPKIQSQKTRLQDCLRAAAEHYRNILLHSPQGEPGRHYLMQRGIDSLTAETFGIGYAPDAWEAVQDALRKEGFTNEEILQSGLTIKSDRGSGYYDRFRGRLLFPIRNHFGTVVGFGGRLLHEDPQNPGAKYINSPQSLVYDKSAVLFGLDLAKGAIKEKKAAILVEGYMDCVSVFQSGTQNVIAVSGTALTEAQALLLKRYTETVLLAFDADQAGAAARDRGLGTLLSLEFDVRVVPIEGAKDPDELIRKDAEAWQRAVAAAPRFMDYFLDKTFASYDPKDLGAKKAAARKLLGVLALLADPIERDHYLARVATGLGVSESALREKLLAIARTPRPQAGTPQSTAVAAPPRIPSEVVLAETFLALLFTRPELAESIIASFDHEAVPDAYHLRALYRQFVVYYTQRHPFVFSDFLASLPADPPAFKERANILRLLGDRNTGELDDDGTRRELATLARRLSREQAARKLRAVTSRIRSAEERPIPQAQHDALLEEFHTLTEQLKRFS